MAVSIAQIKAFAQKTILLRTGGNEIYLEGPMAPAVLPGTLVVGAQVLTYTTMIKCPLIVVIENAGMGKTIHDTYAAGDTVQQVVLCKGMFVQLRVADGETVVAGNLLVPHGDGTVEVASSSNQDYAIAIALGALNLSGSSNADGPNLVPVMIL